MGFVKEKEKAEAFCLALKTLCNKHRICLEPLCNTAGGKEIALLEFDSNHMCVLRIDEELAGSTREPAFVIDMLVFSTDAWKSDV